MPPANDDFAAAIELTGDQISRDADSNLAASKQPGEPNHAGYAGGASVWYRWTAPISRPVIVDTFGSSFDTTLAVYRGDSVDALEIVRSNDDSGSPSWPFQSEVRFDADAGETYRIAVDGYVSPEGEVEQGTVALNLLQLPPPPETVIETGPSGTVAATETSAEFTFSGAADNESYECRLDSIDEDDWTNCVSPYRVSGLDRGEHILEVRGRNAGGVDDTPATREWIVGAPLPAPETTIDSGPASVVDHTTTSATFAFSADGRTRGFECRLDAGTWSRCTSPQTVDGLEPGTHDFAVRSLAPSGAPDETPATYSWTILPPPPPETTIGVGPEAETADRSAQFEFMADVPVDRFECRLDSNDEADWEVCGTPHAISGLGSGIHRIEIRGVNAGGPDPTPAIHEWRVVARNAPDTQITLGPSGTVSSDQARFEFSGTGSIDGFECRIDSDFGPDWRPCSSPRTFTGLSDGEHEVEIRAYNEDASDPTPASRSWTVDTLPPLAETTIDSAPPAQTGDPDAEFEFSAQGTVDRFECKLDEGDWIECDSPYAVAGLSDGAHSFSVRAVNARGTETTPATHGWTITPDPVDPPDTTIESGPPATTTATDASFTFSASGETDGFECRLDALGWTSCDSPHELTGLAVGAHQLAVRASGPGGTDASPAIHSWTVEDVAPPADPPETTIMKAPKKRIVTKASKLTVKLFFASPTPGVQDFECRLGAGTWVDCRSPRAWAIKTAKKAKRYTLSVRAVDEAGQVDATPASAVFTVQKKAKKRRPR